MKIIEFCGLPGCGKTTICERLIENFKVCSSNTNVYCRKDVYFFKRRIWDSYLISRCTPMFFKFYKILNNFIKEYRKGNKRYIDRIYRLYVKLYKISIHYSDSIVILDEGIVQHITSLAHQQKIVNSVSFVRLVDFLFSNFEITVINCCIDMNETIRRIKKRNNENDRFNLSDVDEIKKILNIKNNNINIILEQFHGIRYDLDMNCSVEEIYNELLKLLLNYGVDKL